MTWGSIVAVVTRLWDGQPRNCVSFLSMCKKLPHKTPRSASGAHSASYSVSVESTFSCR